MIQTGGVIKLSVEWEMPIIEHLKPTKWNWVVSYPKNLKLGKNTDIGCFTYINAAVGVWIGNNTQIGSHCSIYSEDTENNIHGNVDIGKNVKIGSHSLILPGSTIKDNEKIKAYSTIKGEKYG